MADVLQLVFDDVALGSGSLRRSKLHSSKCGGLGCPVSGLVPTWRTCCYFGHVVGASVQSVLTTIVATTHTWTCMDLIFMSVWVVGRHPELQPHLPA